MVNTELPTVSNEDSVTEEFSVGLTLDEVNEQIVKLEEELNDMRLNFSSKKYPLVFSQPDIPQESYGNYNDVQAFLNSVYTFIQKDMSWKGEEFLLIDGLFKEITELKSQYKKFNTGGLVLVSALSIETFLRLSIGTVGKGIAEAHKRMYILKPFHNAQRFITEEYDEMERKSKQLTELYVQKHQLENDINPYEPTELPQEVQAEIQ